MKTTKEDKIKDVLEKRVSEVLPEKKSLLGLIKKRKIRLYLGIDPTGRNLHLGHTVPLRKLQEFADLGHEAILVFGTGTVLTGDPSLRSEARKKISEKEIKENIETWKKQVSKVIDFSKVKIKYNGEWLLKLKLKDIINIASNISAIRLFQREMFQRRIKKGDTVWLHETLYPLLQGYDSVAMDVDLEIGGTDQVFNMIIGRELQRKMNNKEKFVMTLHMALGTDGKPMSKTSGNCIWISDKPEDMFGKVMSIPDNLIISYFELFTDVSLKEIKEYEKELKGKKMNPSDLKRKLAFEIVKDYHSEKKAKEAQKEFNRIFREKKAPSDIPSVKIKKEKIPFLDLLFKMNLVSSKKDAKRLILQGAVRIDGKTEKDWKKEIKAKKGQVFQVGKRKFAKVS
jgi:tyrosyl-tRNA synthetase